MSRVASRDAPREASPRVGFLSWLAAVAESKSPPGISWRASSCRVRGDAWRLLVLFTGAWGQSDGDRELCFPGRKPVTGIRIFLEI